MKILQVKPSGDVNVITPDSLKQVEELEEDVEERGPPPKPLRDDHHPPRFDGFLNVDN